MATTREVLDSMIAGCRRLVQLGKELEEDGIVIPKRDLELLDDAIWGIVDEVENPE